MRSSTGSTVYYRRLSSWRHANRERIYQMSKSVYVCLIILCLVSTTAVSAKPCPETITMKTWVDEYAAGPKEQTAYLDQLRTCLKSAKNDHLSEAIDNVIVDFIASLEGVPEPSRQSFVDFTMRGLLMNAEAGFASSQFNYAVLHNAEPGSLAQKLIPQDIPTFVFWTRKAAAQGELRALFNLSTRMVDGVPEAGIPQDMPTAYTILTILEKRLPKDNDFTREAKPYILKTKAKIAGKLGKERVKQLEKEAAHFNLSILAPASTL